MFLIFKEHYKQPIIDGNGSIIPSSLPYQAFMSLIGTCRMGNVSLCFQGFLPPSTPPRQPKELKVREAKRPLQSRESWPVEKG